MKPEAIVLFGDCQVQGPGWPVDPLQHVPTFHLASPVAASLGSLPTLATDSVYGDFDADGIADVPVGRIPIDRADQVEGFVNRLREYESSRHYGPWRHTVDLTAGVGGFGALIDTAIESVARGIITSNMPASMQTRVCYASPTSPYFPGYPSFCETVVDSFNDGGLFWVYAGHGQVTALDHVPPTASGRPILCKDNICLLKRPASQAPIALLLACYTGAFDAKDDCLAEQMLMEPGGPIAVFAGSRMTLPYGNAKIATSMIQSWFGSQPATLGQMWLETAVLATRDPTQETNHAPTMVDAMAAMVSPTADRLPEERAEHTRLYNLLGDPLLRLSHPELMTIKCPVTAAPGETIDVQGSAPHAGTMVIEVHRRGEASRDVLRLLSETDRQRTASRSLVHRVSHEVPSGEFSVPLQLPDTATGSSIIVARIESSDRFSIGNSRVLVDRPTVPQ